MLRTLIIFLAVLGSPLPIFAQAQEDGKFSNDAFGDLGVDPWEIMKEAKRLSEELSVDPDAIEDSARSLREELKDLNLSDKFEQAFKSEEVRDLLGAGDVASSGAGGSSAERLNSDIYIFASFSMPRQMLLETLRDAADFQVPVIFRGFVDNSVPMTKIAFEDLQALQDEPIGFVVDPTLFEAFDIEKVPAVVIPKDRRFECTTMGCQGDSIEHEKILGGVPLEFLLRRFVQFGSFSSQTAQFALDRAAK